MKYLSLLGLTVLAAVPTFAAEPPASAVVAPAAAPTVSATTTTAAVGTAKAEDEARAKLIKLARSRGYKPMMVKGEAMFCRNEPSMGTRFEKAVCLNVQALASTLKREADTQADISAGRNGACLGQGCAEGKLGGP